MAKAAAVAPEPAESEAPKPRAVAKPPPDPNEPIELTALFLDRPYGLNQVSNVIRVNSAVQNGISVGGLCERIVMHPNGTIVVHVRKSSSPGMLEQDKAKMPMQFLTFREGFGEVA